MRCRVLAVLTLLGLGAGSVVLAQTGAEPSRKQQAVVQIAERAAVRLLNFNQGELKSLTDARQWFTAEGWSEFMNHMTGFLDDKGAPTFSSSFVPSGKAVVTGQNSGMIQFKIPGTLTQTQNKSRTTYHHAEIDVTAGGKPVKISHLEQIYKAR